MSKIEIEIPKGKKAKWINNVLTLVDDKPQDITKRIKKLEDACEWCSENGKQNIVDVWCLSDYDDNCTTKDIEAYLKLRIITYALNEGWEPTYNGEEIHYYPYTYVDTDKLSYIDTDKIGVDFSATAVTYPATLCFKSKELAKYAITQFTNIYADFFGLKR